MTRIVLYLILLLIPAMGLHAQGKVTVTQSSAIDAVVNGKKSPQNDKRMSREERRAAKRAEKERQKQEKIRRKNQQLMVPSQPSGSKQRGDAPRVQLPSKRPPAAKEPKITVQEPTGEARDYKRMVLVRRPIRRQVGTETRQVLRRKAPRRGKGFRIAVYSGGNTREDRNKAELAGQKVKDALPDQPVYVHFYSPRWMCLVGNFEEYKDAQKALWKVKKAGYKSANIIRK